MCALMISVAGIRGVVGESLTPDIATKFAAAYGTFLDGGKVCLGYDTRRTRDTIRLAAIAGLLGTGCDVIDLGICPTPTVDLMIPYLECKGAVAVTASHNGPEWNALKFFAPTGGLLGREEGERVIKIFEDEKFSWKGWQDVGEYSLSDEAPFVQIEGVLNLVDVEGIRAHNFKVAIDPGNGTGAVVTPSLLEELGCRVYSINSNPYDLFGRGPEPLPENLGGLAKLVGDVGADIGFAQDPDADRLAIVSDEGVPIGEEYTLALCTYYILSKNPGKVVINLSTSRMIEDIAEQFGAEVIRAPVGEANVAGKMREVGAVIGGEGNGGVIYPPLHYVRDSFIGIGLVLSLLAESGLKLSQLIEELPKYVMRKEKYPIEGMDKEGVLEKARNAFAGADELNFDDGVRACFGKSWVHVRPSGTEPVLRVVAEAPSESELERMLEEVKKILR